MAIELQARAKPRRADLSEFFGSALRRQKITTPGTDSVQKWSDDRYCNVGIAIINHAPLITISMGGKNHQKSVLYYCYTHIYHWEWEWLVGYHVDVKLWAISCIQYWNSTSLEIMVDYLGVANYVTSMCKPSNNYSECWCVDRLSLHFGWTAEIWCWYRWYLWFCSTELWKKNNLSRWNSSTNGRCSVTWHDLHCQIRPLATDLLNRCSFMSAISNYVEQAETGDEMTGDPKSHCFEVYLNSLNFKV